MGNEKDNLTKRIKGGIVVPHFVWLSKCDDDQTLGVICHDILWMVVNAIKKNLVV